MRKVSVTGQGYAAPIQSAYANDPRSAALARLLAPKQSDNPWSGLINAGAAIAGGIQQRKLNKEFQGKDDEYRQAYAQFLGAPDMNAARQTAAANPYLAETMGLPLAQAGWQQQAADQQYQRNRADKLVDTESDRAWQAQQQAERAAREDASWEKRFSRQSAETRALIDAKGRPNAIRTLSPEEAAAAGFPAGSVVQQDSNGAFSVVSKPSQVDGRVPSALIKLESEDIGDLMAAQNSSADIGALRNQIEGGQLPLGPITNLSHRARNAAGMSTPESKNFASFRAGLEKIRNDSLRLNKGVQTEGDAQRAWNELFENLNDPGVVSQRLSEIERLNDRAKAERLFLIQQRRQAVNAPAFDESSLIRSTPIYGAQDIPDDIGAIFKKYGAP